MNEFSSPDSGFVPGHPRYGSPRLTHSLTPTHGCCNPHLVCDRQLGPLLPDEAWWLWSVLLELEVEQSRLHPWRSRHRDPNTKAKGVAAWDAKQPGGEGQSVEQNIW